MNKQKNAFTLVELIVVITILAILGTIAFISLQGYSQDARDSVRISDISKIKTSLELFQLDAGKYPETTEATNITYSGAIAWSQGTFGDKTFSNVEKLDKIPIDPTTDRKYVYSVTNTRQEYQLAGVMEGDEVTSILNQTNAAQKTAMLKISGNYNGKVLKVNTGGIDYILAVPSIITSSGFTVNEIVQNNYLAYNGYKNLPAQYVGSSYNVLGEDGITLVNSADLVVYSGDIKTLSDTTSLGITARKIFIGKLKGAYIGTELKNVGEISQIVNIDTDDTTAVDKLGTIIVSNNLGGSVAVSSGGGDTITNSCDEDTKPTDNTHIIYTSNPTSVNQEYVQDGTECGYTCKDGYTGIDCSIAPILQWKDIQGTNCTNDDYVFTLAGITYTWAGCNSILGTTGVTTNSDVYNGTCYNYAGGTTTTNCNSTYLTYTAKEDLYNPTNGENNIWGKLYLWANAVQPNNACPTGWHTASDSDFEKLETHLNGGINCRNASDDRLCTGLGWAGKSLKTENNNIVKALKISLSGAWDNSNYFRYRGSSTNFWTETALDVTRARGRTLSYHTSLIGRYSWSKDNANSVRCVKD